MPEFEYDHKGRLVGYCTYCMRLGRAKNLKKLPKELDTNQIGSYCPDCYDNVLQSAKDMPWNKHIKHKY